MHSWACKPVRFILIIIRIKARHSSITTNLTTLTHGDVDHQSLSQQHTPHQEQQTWAWQDIIGLQSPFHRNFNTWHSSPGLVRHADGDGDREPASLHWIIVCGIWKGHLREALDMTSSTSICMLWLLCGLNITDGFRTSGATGHFSVEAAKSYPHRLKKKKKTLP